MSFVFQYGSNCDAERLNGPDRLKGHARVIGAAQTAENWKIAFNVYSHGNHCAASDMISTSVSGGKAWGVLYEIPDEFIRGKRTDGQKTLKSIEGRSYEEKPILVCDRNGNIIDEPVTTFLVIPAERRLGLWTNAKYVGYIVKGLRAQVVPENYVQQVIDIAIETNKRAKRFADEESRQIESLQSNEGNDSPSGLSSSGSDV
jgi:hypothetical protein